MGEYIEWLCASGYWFGPELAQYELTSPDFDAYWKWLAKTNREDFEKSQHDYIRYAYYDPAVRILADAGWHIENHAEVMKDVVWSRAVQYGVGNIKEMWEDACHCMWNTVEGAYTGYPNLSYIDDASFDYDFIYAIYLLVCSSEEWNNSSLRDSLNYRFQRECNEALARL